MQENKPILIVGLGNPGAQYVRTRHNVGFIAVMRMAGDDATWQTMGNARISPATINGRRVIFAMPQTFMNASGDAVRALMSFYKIPIENLVVIHDDMDIAVGNMRTKVGGGAAGHNGIRSIDSAVGPDYRRIRIGISHPRDFDLPINPADWVLGQFTNDQMTLVIDVIDNLGDITKMV